MPAAISRTWSPKSSCSVAGRSVSFSSSESSEPCTALSSSAAGAGRPPRRPRAFAEVENVLYTLCAVSAVFFLGLRSGYPTVCADLVGGERPDQVDPPAAGAKPGRQPTGVSILLSSPAMVCVKLGLRLLGAARGSESVERPRQVPPKPRAGQPKPEAQELEPASCLLVPTYRKGCWYTMNSTTVVLVVRYLYV